MNDFEKMLSILNNQQEPSKPHDWKVINYTVRRKPNPDCNCGPDEVCGNCDLSNDLDICIKEDQITFVFDKKTKRLKFISNYK